MLNVRQMFLLSLCFFNISLPMHSTIKNIKENIKTMLSEAGRSTNKDEDENINKTLEKLESTIQSNNQKTHFILKPLCSVDLPTIPTLATDPEQQAFIAETGIDVLRLMERTLITRPDYIAEYSDEPAIKAIREYKNKCILLQQKGDLYALFNEINRLYQRVIASATKNNSVDYICLALAERAYENPIATILHMIKNAPLKVACKELRHLRRQILEQAQGKNIFFVSKITELSIEQYCFDVIDVARNCYISRNDHIDITKHEPILPDDLKHILSIIEHKYLPIAHAELIHLKKQIREMLESRNILDPVMQKEFIIETFGCDTIELAHNIYKGRLDHKTLISYYRRIDVEATMINMLCHGKYNYESLAQQFYLMAEKIFYNAKLCSLNLTPTIKAVVYNAIETIKGTTHNSAEFLSNATLINEKLSNIQTQVYSIIHAEDYLLNISLEPFTQAIEIFFARQIK